MNVNLTCPICGKLCNMKKDEYIRRKGKPGRQYFHRDCYDLEQKKIRKEREKANNGNV